MPRGYLWRTYVTDNDDEWALRVDADQAADPTRGWPEGPVISVPMPRGWLPRVVWGRDELGQFRQTRVGSTSADLWTGVAATFTIEGTDAQPHTVVVEGRKAERLKPTP